MKRAFLAALLAVVCIGVFVQYQALRKLKAEGAALRAQLAERHALAEAESAARAQQPTDAELERLREERSELVRLRGQVAELRRDLKSMQQAMARANSAAANAAAKTNINAADLVQAFVANVQATVPPQQMLVTGGWKLPSGKHALVFIEPVVADAFSNSQGEISVQARFIELSEEALARHGFSGLKSDGTEAGGQMVLTDARRRELLGALEQETGVDILTAPRVSTLSGRQAQIKVAESFETGPVLDLVPTVAADGRSVDLRVSAQLPWPRVRRGAGEVSSDSDR